MRFLGPDLVLATSDLTKYVRCEHATFLDHGTKRGSIEALATRPPSPMTELIADKGEDHEHAYLEKLRAAGKRVVTIDRPEWTLGDLIRAERATLEAMRGGADYIYQAALFDGRWYGRADLLERTGRPSPRLGDWSYEVVDTKFARAVKSHFLLQLSDYSHHVGRLQGQPPPAMHVVLGTNERLSFPVDAYAAYYRHVRASVERFLAEADTPSPYPVEFCALCDWSAHCWKHWNAIDHLSLVANIRRTQVTRLERGGITTLTELGKASPRSKVRRIPEESFAVLQDQARLQLEQRESGVHKYELLPLAPERGFQRLPKPSPGDVFLDLEGDPFVSEGLTYLFGAAWEENGEPQYRVWWAHDPAEERTRFEEVLDFLAGRRAADPAAHIYHYGAIEVATLKRLMGRHGTREHELDDLLRREAFVDLATVVRQSMRISHTGYGLKKVETFYYQRESEGVRDAGGAVLAYERWLETNDPAMLADIEKYNAEDCVSILHMRRWLIGIRPAAAEWKAPQEAKELTVSRIEEDQQSDALFQQLTAGTAEKDPARILGHLLYYHRREERPAWWRFFERQKMTPDELVDDGESIGGLTLDESVAPVPDKKSKIFTYRFPAQEHKFQPGDVATDAATGEGCGEIAGIDDATGVLTLRRGPKLLTAPPPAAIIPKPSISSGPLRAAVRRFAEKAVERGLDGMPYRAGADILLRRAPRVVGVAPGEPIQTGTADVASIADVVTRLDESYLFVQGPPGSGKTYAGARVIAGLLRGGKRVGVTSNSHAAIHNLLAEVERVAAAEGFSFRGLKKGKAFDSPHGMIESTDDIAVFADRTVPLVAGTAWLFSHEEMDQTLDYLFVDEAGQVSLANAIAVSTAARNVVLLGDPLQLAQVSQGSHPPGAGASVLEHLLGDDATVPRDRGIFLEHTWRMHPAVCAFVSDVVYDARLRSADECAAQAVSVDGIAETGLRFIGVEHVGNGQSSDEEAQWIAAEIGRMLRGSFTDARGETRPLQPADFLIVAAYNAQVRRLTAALRCVGLGEVAVGTVDKFQGRQAPVVFFSMATSSGAELPRDIDFLFSRNRLNVAISRARCVATVVASPRLLDVDCRNPEQMRLVNGVCRFREMARTA